MKTYRPFLHLLCVTSLALGIAGCPLVTTYTLTVSVTGSGSVSPSGGAYASGASVSLTATPNTGWTFARWEGDLSGSDNPATITMNGNRTVTAVFEEEAVMTYTLSVSVTGNGSVSPNSGAFDDGETVSLTATPDDGWQFARWEGDLSGSDNPATITMSADRTVTAVFEAIPVTFELTVNVTGSGSVSPAGGTFNANQSVSIAATPAEGWEFARWEGDLSGSDNPATITMSANRNVTAVFEESVDTFQLSVTVTGSGAVSPASGTYDDGESVELEATANDGWRFVEWQGDLTGPDNPATVTMTQDFDITAVFVLDTALDFEFYASYDRIIDQERHGISLFGSEVDMDNAGNMLAGYAFDDDYWYAFTTDAAGLAPQFWTLDFTDAHPRDVAISGDGTRAYVASDFEDGEGEKYPALLKMVGDNATLLELRDAIDEDVLTANVLNVDLDGTGIYFRDGQHHHLWHCDQNGLNFTEVIDPSDYTELDGTEGLWISEFGINDGGGHIAFIMERWKPPASDYDIQNEIMAWRATTQFTRMTMDEDPERTKGSLFITPDGDHILYRSQNLGWLVAEFGGDTALIPGLAAGGRGGRECRSERDLLGQHRLQRLRRRHYRHRRLRKA